MKYSIEKKPYDYVTNLDFLDNSATALLFEELAYYLKNLHGFDVKKIELEGVQKNESLIFHEAHFERGAYMKEFPQHLLDQIFLNKNGVVTKTAHALNHGKIWYLKQLTQDLSASNKIK